MRYLVSPWHPGSWKHAITLVMWQTTRNSRSPFWVPTPAEALLYVHLSSMQKYSSLLRFGGAACRNNGVALAPFPRLPSATRNRSNYGEARASGCGFGSQKHFKLIFHFIYSFKHALALHAS